MPPAFAGFQLTERLAVDSFGESYAAIGPGGRKARVRRVDAALAQRKIFAQTLLAAGQQLAVIEHPNVVATIAVGKDAEGTLTIVMEAVEGAITLQGALRDAKVTGAKPSQPVALYLARCLAHGLGRAHRAGVVHSGVHPRSIWIDPAGEVKLADFAVARALAAAAEEESSLLQGLLGYVPPELALGDPMDARSDVYGVGALLQELIGADAPPVLADAIGAMMHPDPAARPPDAVALAAKLDLVADSLGARGIGPADVARFVAETKGRAERSLDAETEDLLANLAAAHSDLEVKVEHTPLPAPLPSHEVGSGVFMALREPLGNNTASDGGNGTSGLLTTVQPDPAERARTRKPTFPLEPPEPTASGVRGRTERDRELTPTPGLEPTFEGSVDINLNTPVPQPMPTMPTKSLRHLTPVPIADPPPPADAPPAAAIAAPEPKRRPSTPPPVAASTPAPAPKPAPVPELVDLRPRGLSGAWILATLLSLGALGVVLYWKTDLFHPGRREERRQAAIAEQKAKQAAIDAARVKRGDVVVDSDPPEAAVWLRLGRAPLDTMPFDTAAIRELRIESDGYMAGDAVVGPAMWSGEGEAQRAAVKVTLKPAPTGYLAPAAPPEPNVAQAAVKKGRGVIHVDSEPPGAEVWLLVGFTPTTRVQALPIDKDLDFKVALDGYVPGPLVVRPSDWNDGNGGTKLEQKIAAKLTPRPPAATPPKP